MVFEMESGLPGTLRLRVFQSVAAQTEAVLSAVRQAVMTAVRARGRASLVVSAHPALKRPYALLAQNDLPWQHVDIVLSDAPAVPLEHPASAEHWLRRTLLQGHAAQARFVPLWNGGDTASAEHATAHAEQRLEAIALPHDLVLLALDADGHIAGLPDKGDGVAAQTGTHRCALRPPTETTAWPRIALTARGLLDSRHIVIAGQGLGVRDAFERAALMTDPNSSPLQSLAFDASQPIEFCWCR